MVYFSAMLTEKDISTVVARVVAVVATKEDVAEIREEVAELNEKFDRQLVLLDKLVGAVDAMRLEYAAVSAQLTRHEEWIKKLAEKAGVTLEY
ncbi:MAG TPA: hypothetical protein VMV68_06270 [Spirochaetia bacterium]|nr:hypothetical protein [Spirochaetia bacterium]